MSAEQLSPAQLATAAEHLTAAKMFSLASCVMLFYDIAITFGDEVEKIWKQRFTGATVLWFLNRYLSPLGYIVIIVSFHDPSWSKAACQRYVLYPEVLKIFTATVVGLIFILRLYSIYSKRNIILYGFGTLLVAELAVKIWAFTDGVMLQLPPGFVGCILTGRSSPGDRIIYTWVAELVFDSVVFFATLYRTVTLYRRTLIGEALSLITVIMRDGIMYFAAIFVSNLVTVLIFVFAPPDLKVINASFSTLITSLMVSRLMLNLRGEVLRRGPVMRSSSGRGGGYGAYDNADGVESYQLTATAGDLSGKTTFASSLIGNLGAPIITFDGDDYDREYDLYGDEDEEDDYKHGADARSRSHNLTKLGVRATPQGRSAGSGGLDKKPSLTRTFAQTHPLPKLLGKRRPRTAEGRTSSDQSAGFDRDPAEHTRSLPGHLVVQVTEEEVVIVDEAPDPARSPIPRSLRSSHRSSPSLPASPAASFPSLVHTPSSPHTPTSPASPASPTSPTSPSSLSPRTPRSAYPSRPPHSAGAAYPPTSPHAPESPLAPGSPGSPPGSRPPRPSRSAQAMRRSWIPPPSWRLSLDRDRDRDRSDAR